MQSQVKGFTFIEVLVVMLIFTVMLAFIGYASGVFSSDKQELERASQKLFNQMQILQQKSLLHQSVYRVAFYGSNSYEIQRFDMDNQTWKTLLKPRSLKPQKLPKPIVFSYEIDNATKSAEILFQPSGEITAFSLVLYNGFDTRTIRGLKEGLIHIEDPAHDET